MESGGISRVIDFLAKRPELDQCRQLNRDLTWTQNLKKNIYWEVKM